MQHEDWVVSARSDVHINLINKAKLQIWKTEKQLVSIDVGPNAKSAQNSNFSNA